MFALKSLSKYLFGDSSKENIVELAQGQLYIVRPLSPKGYSELIFKDAAALIRRTGQEYQYQLVIQRAYEEGEAELLEEEEGGEGSGEGVTDRDEKTFVLDEELHFRTDLKDTGESVLAWRDLSGDPGDLVEFVCDPCTRPESVASFELVAAQCQFERKYRTSHEQATEADLQEFNFEEESAIPQASPLASPIRSPSFANSSPLTQSLHNIRDDREMARDSTKKLTAPTPQKQIENTPTKAPASRKAPTSRSTLANQRAELHLFDFTTTTFLLQDDQVQAVVSEIGDWRYWLQVTGSKQQWLGQEVGPDMNPVFNFEEQCLIFNHYSEDGAAYSWLLRFKEREELEGFQQGFMQAMWEHANEIKWQKAADQDYVLDAFNDMVLEDDVDDQREAEAAEEDEEEEDDFDDANDARHSEEEYDEDEEEDEAAGFGKGDAAANSQLAVGAKVDRSFVVRGNKIGVFKHGGDNELTFDTAITNVATPGGKSFQPKKIMLHAGDRDMVLQRENDPNSLYRLDLETGKVVDEWKVHDDIPINVYAPESKFAQTTGEQTFLGLSHNALYRVDPRLSGNKLVDAELKQYTSKNDFSAAATTEQGYIAVASNKGDIRMFDRLGINAKTALPALGDPIIGIDVSADGRWLLATTKTYLLLIDNLQKEGKNEGKLGFEKAFPKDAKPQPRRLALTPAHVAQFQHETGVPLSFTAAHFNTGESKEETTIISSTGPFVVSWNMRRVLQGRKDAYHIRRYGEEVKADNFRFGSDKNIEVVLPHDVNMVNRRALQRVTRESIAALPAVTPKKGRGSYLSRSEVVNSPY